MRGRKYTKEQEDFIRSNDGISLKELADRFNNRFGGCVSHSAIGKKRTSLGMDHLPTRTGCWTEEMDQYLLDNWEKFTSREIANKILIKFGENVATQTVTDRMQRIGIKRGKRYRPNNHVPSYAKEIGSERIEKGRTVLVKVGNPNKWIPKTMVICPHDPKEEQVIFLDGNSLNVTEENIVIVKKRAHSILAKNGWLGKDKRIVLAGIKWAELVCAIKDMKP